MLTYFSDYKDARQTLLRIKQLGAGVILMNGDISNAKHCQAIVRKTISTFNKIDILIHNAAVQYSQDKLSAHYGPSN